MTTISSPSAANPSHNSLTITAIPPDLKNLPYSGVTKTIYFILFSLKKSLIPLNGVNYSFLNILS